MSLRAKKIVVLTVLATVILLANVWAIAGWLDGLGIVSWAQYLRSEYATGTAITVILVLVFLLGGAGTISTCARLIRRCPVCDRTMLRPGEVLRGVWE
jgi:hypothetical protein